MEESNDGNRILRHSSLKSLRIAYRKIRSLGGKSEAMTDTSNRRVPRVSILDFGGDFYVEVTEETEKILSDNFHGLLLDVNGRSEFQSPLPKRISRQVLQTLIRESRIQQLASGDDDIPRAMKSPSCPNMSGNFWRFSVVRQPTIEPLPKPLAEILQYLPYDAKTNSNTKDYSGDWACGPSLDGSRTLARKASKYSTNEKWIPDLTKSSPSFPVQLYEGHDFPRPPIRRHKSEVSTLVSRDWAHGSTRSPSMLESLFLPQDSILEKDRFQQEPESMEGCTPSSTFLNEWRTSHFEADLNSTLIGCLSPDLQKIPDRFRFPAKQPVKEKHPGRIRSLSRSFIQRLQA